MKEQNLISLEEFITALQALPYPAALILEKNKEEVFFLGRNQAFSSYLEIPENKDTLPEKKNCLDVLNIQLEEKSRHPLIHHGGHTFPLRTRTAEGKFMSVTARIIPIRQEEGEVLSLFLLEDKREQDRLLQKLNKIHLQYDAFFEQSPDIRYLIDTRGYFREMNLRGAEYFKRSKEEIIGLHYLEVIHELDHGLVNEYFRKVLEKQVAQVELRSVTKTGDVGYLDITAIPVIIEGEVMEVFGIAKDISKRKDMEIELLESEERYRSLFEDNIDAVVTYDLEGNFLHLNKATEDLMGYSAEELIGKPFLPFIVPEYQQFTLKEFSKVLNGHSIRYETAMYNRKQEVVHLHITVMPLIIGGEMKGIHCIGKDITNRKNMERSLKKVAYQDHLTHLPNQRAMMEDFERLLEDEARIGVLVLDLDRFKSINDNWGHEVGDELLKAVSQRLLYHVHERRAKLYRYGGDEYIFLYGFTERNQVESFAENLQALFKDPFIIHYAEVSVSSSIGISTYPEDGEDLETLLKKSDNAMYYSKKTGRNHATFYGTKGMEREDEALRMELLLKEAMKKEEFSLVYQPQVELSSGRITGVEALLRWHSQELGTVPPNQFIKVAEDSGLIIELGNWVTKKALSDLAKWNQMGYQLEMSVNISTHQFYHPEFLLYLERIIRDQKVPPSQLVLEITESIASHAEVVLKELQKIKEMGLKVAIDDFGTGYSSLKYLKDFPIDYLKIDKSFVDGIEEDDKSRDIVSTIITLAHNLGLLTVAEGAETREQVDFLKMEGCDSVQGYYYGKPMTEAMLLEFLNRVQGS